MSGWAAGAAALRVEWKTRTMSISPALRVDTVREWHPTPQSLIFAPSNLWGSGTADVRVASLKIPFAAYLEGREDLSSSPLFFTSTVPKNGGFNATIQRTLTIGATYVF